MQSDDEILAKLMVSSLGFLTAKEKELLAENIDNPSKLALLSKDDVSKIVQRDLKRVSWNGEETKKSAERSLRIVRALGIKSACVSDSDYPAMLREMDDFPYMVFYRGNLSVLEKPCVSVVGTRRATAEARRAAFEFSRDACDADSVVVSGLAYGIDIESHKGALEGARGGTVAVLPCGIDTIVPSAHTKIAAAILKKGGLLLSEYIPGTPALAFRFVQRNRIVAALSPATLVVQAPVGSGAMITAGLALDYNRDVLFHAEAFSPSAQRMNEIALEKLMREGAAKKSIQSKIDNSPERFVRDGASVVSSFSEYVRKRSGAADDEISSE